MGNRRQVLGAVMAFALGGGVALAQTPLPKGHKQVTVHLHNALHIKQLPLVIALQLGYFRAEGLEVSLAPLEADQMPDAELISTSFDKALQMGGGARSLIAFVMLARAPQVVLARAARSARSNGSVKHLRGCSIGVLGLGSPSHKVTELMLYRAGLSAEDVSFVDLADTSRLLEAFYGGEIEALSISDPWASLLERRGDIRVLSDTRSLRESEQLFGGPVPCTCLMATPEFMRHEVQTCQALSNALVRAMKWLQTAGPADVIRLLPEANIQGDRSLFLDAFSKSRETFATDGLLPVAGAETLARAMAQIHVSYALDHSKFNHLWTNRFVERSKAIYRI